MTGRPCPHAISLVLMAVCAAALPACEAPPQRQRLADALAAQPDVSERELEALIADTGYRVAQKFIQTATRIYESTDDPEVRRRALVWNARLVAESTRASFFDDPLGSAIEIWVLLLQNLAFLEEGDGRDFFGDKQALALETSREVLEAYRELMIDRFGLAAMEEQIVAYARDRPLTGKIMARRSAAPLLASMASPQAKRSLLASTETFEQGMADIAHRLETLQFVLPYALAINLRLLVEDLKDELGGVDLATAIERLDQVIELAATLPDELEYQRQDSIAVVQAEVTRVIDEIEFQRTDSLDRIEELRFTAVAAVDQQRALLAGDLAELADSVLASAGQRIQGSLNRIDETLDRSLGTLDAEVTMAFDRIEAIISPQIDHLVTATIDRTDLEVEEAIDRVFLRVLQLIGVAFVAGLVLIFVARFRRG
ncbi:MAG: hypothetical protein ACYTJ0_10930 [Planctomycetota bacterium]|jgi:hypothetical protein